MTTKEKLEKLSGQIGGMLAAFMPDGVGFGFLVFDLGPKGNLAWMSSGRRSDMIVALQEFIEHEGACESTDPAEHALRRTLEFVKEDGNELEASMEDADAFATAISAMIFANNYSPQTIGRALSIVAQLTKDNLDPPELAAFKAGIDQGVVDSAHALAVEDARSERADT